MNWYAIQGGRATGKTTTLMGEIRDYTVETGRRVLVVTQTHHESLIFLRAWQVRYSFTPLDVVSIDRVGVTARGRRYGMIVIENVDTLEDGVYDERIRAMAPSCAEEMIFTSSPIALNGSAHTLAVTKQDVLRKLYDWSLEEEPSTVW